MASATHRGKPRAQMDGVLLKETRERDRKGLKLLMGPKGQVGTCRSEKPQKAVQVQRTAGAHGRRLSGAWALQSGCIHGDRNVNIYLGQSIRSISILSVLMRTATK